MDQTTITTIVAVVAIAIAAYAAYQTHKAGKVINAEFLTSTLQESTTTATELTEVALTAAQAAEQLYRTRKIQKSARLDHAFNYVKKWFPDLDQARIITAIEAGVFVVNSVVESLPESIKTKGIGG